MSGVRKARYSQNRGINRRISGITQNDDAPIELHAVVGKRNQLTLPAEAVHFLGVHEGDVIIIELKRHSATLRPMRRSYAGAFAGVYGDGQKYVKGERDTWE